jgi:hypothetical protein
MSKNIWRCRCGKRVEMLTDENFGDCGCSDPVYGPEYFYMSKECADMLDEMDKDYDEQHKQLAEAQAEIERKGKLIEQMREALKRLKEEEKPNGYHDCIDDGLGECAWCEAEAALSAAERGER